LQLSPYTYSLNGTLRWKTEHEQKPRDSRRLYRYIHLLDVIPITPKVKSCDSNGC